jgi:hypothetical protein
MLTWPWNFSRLTPSGAPHALFPKSQPVGFSPQTHLDSWSTPKRRQFLAWAHDAVARPIRKSRTKQGDPNPPGQPRRPRCAVSNRFSQQRPRHLRTLAQHTDQPSAGWRDPVVALRINSPRPLRGWLGAVSTFAGKKLERGPDWRLSPPLFRPRRKPAAKIAPAIGAAKRGNAGLEARTRRRGDHERAGCRVRRTVGGETAGRSSLRVRLRQATCRLLASPSSGSLVRQWQTSCSTGFLDTCSKQHADTRQIAVFPRAAHYF